MKLLQDTEASTAVERSWLGGLITYRIIRDLDDGTEYLRRWNLWLPFGFTVKLHHIIRPDKDRCEHDHPWTWLRMILWGGYTEVVNGVPIYRGPGHIGLVRTKFRHRIAILPKGHSWSLIVTGPRVKEWGFYTVNGWKPWRRFVDAAREYRLAWCEDKNRTQFWE